MVHGRQGQRGSLSVRTSPWRLAEVLDASGCCSRPAFIADRERHNDDPPFELRSEDPLEMSFLEEANGVTTVLSCVLPM